MTDKLEKPSTDLSFRVQSRDGHQTRRSSRMSRLISRQIRRHEMRLQVELLNDSLLHLGLHSFWVRTFVGQQPCVERRVVQEDGDRTCMSDGEWARPSFGQGRRFDIEHQLQGQISTRGETANGYVCSIDVQSSTLVFGELVGDAFPQFSVPRSFRVQDSIDDIFAIVVGPGELLVRPQSVIHADDDTSEVSTQLRTERCLLRRRTQDHASSMMVEHNGDMRGPRFDRGIGWDEDGYGDGPI